MRRSPTSKFYVTQHLVYFFASDKSQTVKIGYTSNIRSRVEALRKPSTNVLRTLLPNNPYLIGFIRYSTRKEAQEAEARFHQWFAEFRIHGEWFEFNVQTRAMIERAVFESRSPLEQLFEEYI